MNARLLQQTLATGLTLSLVGGGFALGRATGATKPAAAAVNQTGTAAPEPPTAPRTGGQAPASFAPLAAEASPTVVHVKVTSIVKAAADGAPFGLPPDLGGDEESPFRGFSAPRRGGFTQRGSGSGFIIRKDGVVLTNNHVVENAKQITVTLSDGRELDAKVMGRDPKTDLAVLKINPEKSLPTAKLGDSDGINVGDWVVAIGNPYGLSNSVTAGIVSAKGRAIGAGPYDDFIQTDAPINPGNSGGPLLNDRGEVVGINSAIFSQTGGSVGIGFAIPINLAKKLVPELEETGHVTRAWLGVTIQELTPDLAKSLNVEPPHGALVAGVASDSPAAASGIKPGDVITRYDGKEVKEHATLPMLAASTTIGKTVPVEVVRDGKVETFEVTVAQQAGDETPEKADDHKGKWGLALRDLSPEEREQRNLKAGEGVLVADVADDSPAAQAGITAGDVILQVNRKSVTTVEQVKREVAVTSDGRPLLLLLVRPADGNERFAALTPR